jgi:hypothetical protein
MNHGVSKTAAPLCLVLLLLGQAFVSAHSGPPFPVLSNRRSGAYDISIWTDPDATDDRTPAGKFWIVLATGTGDQPPAGTRARVAIRALDRQGDVHEGPTEPVDGVIGRQFVALLMDHEGPFAVTVTVDGPLGRTEVESRVDATYDLRPSRFELLVFMIPFVAVGGLWMIVLRRRRQDRRRAASARSSTGI